MKRIIYFSLVAFLIVMGCAKDDELGVNPGENELKSALTATPFGAPGDNNIGEFGMLQTSLWYPPAITDYFAQYPLYDFSSYKVRGQKVKGYNPDKEYNPANYDVMAHFGYKSSVAIPGAVVEFTFHHIKYFVPHFTNANQQRIYSVSKDEDNDDEIVITCTTDLIAGMNPMFCFIMKIHCDEDGGGLTTFWTDMKINGISVKGTIKDKVFACE